VNGEAATRPLMIASTFDASDPIAGGNGIIGTSLIMWQSFGCTRGEMF